MLSNGAHAGFLLGSRQTLLETKDGGRTWEPRKIKVAEDEGFNYRFTSISFAGDEGWIVGKPAILLHTTDGGANWERIPLSAKLPGNPVMIYATPGKPGNAEMTTDQVCPLLCRDSVCVKGLSMLGSLFFFYPPCCS